VAALERLTAVGDQALEVLGVELARTDAEAVAGRRGDQRLRVADRFA
jgi:hypothetical protein